MTRGQRMLFAHWQVARARESGITRRSLRSLMRCCISHSSWPHATAFLMLRLMADSGCCCQRRWRKACQSAPKAEKRTVPREFAARRCDLLCHRHMPLAALFQLLSLVRVSAIHRNLLLLPNALITSRDKTKRKANVENSTCSGKGYQNYAHS
eukprot:150882-Rhodomonas_salina.1